MNMVARRQPCLPQQKPLLLLLFLLTFSFANAQTPTCFPSPSLPLTSDDPTQPLEPPSPVGDCEESSPNIALGDIRTFHHNSQCRVLCSAFSNPSFSVSHEASKCPFCLKPETDRFIGGAPGKMAVCVPRGVCTKMCGPESSGCVYTGSCASQICFKGKSGQPAKLTRLTHAGPGSIITVEDTVDGNSEPSPVSTSDERRTALARSIIRGHDTCARSEAWKLNIDTDECATDGSQPLVDGKLGPVKEGVLSGTQCRTACPYFGLGDFEIVHYRTGCEFCSRPEADDFADTENKHICIPRETCQERCGKEQDGCVYTGSCKTQICYSGLDSKKAAEVSLPSDSGEDATIIVDNTGDPKTIDPPAFAALPDSEDEVNSVSTEAAPPTPSTPVPTEAAPPTPSTPVPTEAATSSTPGPKEPASAALSSPSTPGNRPDEESSKWAWLGPVLGFVGAILAAASAIFAAYLMREKRAGQPSESQQMGSSTSTMTLVLQDRLPPEIV